MVQNLCQTPHYTLSNGHTYIANHKTTRTNSPLNIDRKKEREADMGRKTKRPKYKQANRKVNTIYHKRDLGMIDRQNKKQEKKGGTRKRKRNHF